MKNNVGVETAISYDLEEALLDIANRNGWSLNDVYNHAIDAFIVRWMAGKTSHRYFGTRPDWITKMVRMPIGKREDLHRIRYEDGASMMVIVQEALHCFAEEQGFVLPVVNPPNTDRSHDES